MRLTALTLLPLLCVMQSACSEAGTESAPQSTAPSSSTESTQASTFGSPLAQGNANVTLVKLETTKGDIVIEVHSEWAPNGAQRFLELVNNGFYDGVKFFRVIEGFMAQTGMNGDPEMHQKWMDNNIQDDPVTQSNKRGYVTFAQTAAPNSRSTQFFINYTDRNAFLDSQRFAPFGVVVEGMDVVDSLYNGYGESPNQGMIIQKGNEYLEAKFPKLDTIKKASVVESTDA